MGISRCFPACAAKYAPEKACWSLGSVRRPDDHHDPPAPAVRPQLGLEPAQVKFLVGTVPAAGKHGQGVDRSASSGLLKWVWRPWSEKDTRGPEASGWLTAGVSRGRKRRRNDKDQETPLMDVLQALVSIAALPHDTAWLCFDGLPCSEVDCFFLFARGKLKEFSGSVRDGWADMMAR